MYLHVAFSHFPTAWLLGLLFFQDSLMSLVFPLLFLLLPPLLDFVKICENRPSHTKGITRVKHGLNMVTGCQRNIGQPPIPTRCSHSVAFPLPTPVRSSAFLDLLGSTWGIRTRWSQKCGMSLVSPFQLVLNLRIKIQFHLPLEGLSAQLMRIRNCTFNSSQKSTRQRKCRWRSHATSVTSCNSNPHAPGTPPARRPHRPEHPTSAEAHPGTMTNYTNFGHLWALEGQGRAGRAKQFKQKLLQCCCSVPPKTSRFIKSILESKV